MFRYDASATRRLQAARPAETVTLIVLSACAASIRAFGRRPARP